MTNDIAIASNCEERLRAPKIDKRDDQQIWGTSFPKAYEGWGGEGAAAPPDLKNFRANSVFRASASRSKILNDKRYSNTVNSGQTLFFRASVSCLKILNVKSIFNTVKNFRANSVFQGKRKLLKNPERWKILQYTVCSTEGDPCNLGTLFIFRGDCFFQGKFFPPPPIKCFPVRLWSFPQPITQKEREKNLNPKALITYKRPTTIGQLLANYKHLALRTDERAYQRVFGSLPLLCTLW